MKMRARRHKHLHFDLVRMMFSWREKMPDNIIQTGWFTDGMARDAKAINNPF